MGHTPFRQRSGAGGEILSRKIVEPARFDRSRIALFYAIPAINTAATDRLGLIITRTDAWESSDPIGAYTIVLHPAATTP